MRKPPGKKPCKGQVKYDSNVASFIPVSMTAVFQLNNDFVRVFTRMLGP